VWIARRVRGNSPLQWFAPTELLERVGSPVLRDPATLAALTVAARSPLIPEWSGAAFGAQAADAAPEDVARASRLTLSEMRVPLLKADLLDPARAAPEQFLNPSSRGSNSTRACSRWPKTRASRRPRAIRFLGILLDPTWTTSSRRRSAALKQLAALKRAGPSADQLRPRKRSTRSGIRLRPLIARQYRLFDALLRNRAERAAWRRNIGRSLHNRSRRSSAPVSPIVCCRFSVPKP